MLNRVTWSDVELHMTGEWLEGVERLLVILMKFYYSKPHGMHRKIVYYGCIESIYDNVLSIKQKHYTFN
jgi:hypothetical protein